MEYVYSKRQAYKFPSVDQLQKCLEWSKKRWMDHDERKNNEKLIPYRKKKQEKDK
jgi:hypothetical protein